MGRRKSNEPALREMIGERPVVGTFIKLPALESIDIVAATGFDFALVDLEHSQLSDGDALRLVRHAAAIGLPAVVRMPAVDAGLINRLLEAGAHGIQLSTVTTIAQVHELVAATGYAPHGRRSVSLSHPTAGYGSVPLREAVAGPPPLRVGQIETGATGDPLETILRAGLDVAFLGVVDLSVDLGFDDERVRARVEEVRAAADAAGVILGLYAADRSAIGDGIRYVALSSDVAMLRTAAARAFDDGR
jgi:4-hydroxy-2-oxoheptanedioate aldolase